jgi:hypothetical protein
MLAGIWKCSKKISYLDISTFLGSLKEAAKGWSCLSGLRMKRTLSA